MRIDRLCIGLVPLVVLASSAGAAVRESQPAPAVSAQLFEQHLARLASDEFEGRKPGTRGEEKTLAYLTDAYRRIGLKPAVGSSYLQQVPLVEITTASDATLELEAGGKRFTPAYGEEMVVWTKRVVPQVHIEASPLVFVGYGIVAPEYGWNDYAGLDMRGKTAVILINDPGFATRDPQLFRGRTLTYYGRWTYKFEEAARQGAAGAIIVHETEPAAYGWETVANSWTGPQLDKSSADGNAGRIPVEGWITLETARQLFGAAGQDYAALKQRAARRGFRPVPLDGTASASLRNAIRQSSSANVIGVLPGTERPHEYIVYMAHWDHLGRGLGKSGDVIFNGAVDNATGVAGILAIAAAFASAKPERSVVFLATTAEESGLLGSAYYADNPVFPLAQTVAAINLDAIYFGGPTHDVTVVGYGASELEDYLAAAAKAQGRELRPEPQPEKGFFFRSDHFNFAKRGVPALYTKLGIDDRERGAKWGQRQADEFVAERYHKPADEYAPGVDLRGAVEDLQLLYRVGARLAAEKSFPNWREDSEFRAIRDRSRAVMTR